MPDFVIVSDYAGEPFGRKLAQKLGCQYVHASIELFPDGEADIRVLDNIRGRIAHYVCPFQPDAMRRFTEVALINSALKYSSAASIVDVPTYLGFMKKDWKDKPRVPISIREVAISVEQYAQRVITIDMHSQQIEAVFRIPVDHLDGTKLIAEHIENHYELDSVVIASPDLGRGKRAERLASRLGTKNLAIVYKIRDIVTGETVARGVMGNVKGSDVIFIDDQAVTLGTLVAASAAVIDEGARSVVAYCTHGVMAAKDDTTAEQKLSDSLIQKLYIMDTIPRPPPYFEINPKIEEISAIDLFAEAIRRNHTGESLSALFDGQ